MAYRPPWEEAPLELSLLSLGFIFLENNSKHFTFHLRIYAFFPILHNLESKLLSMLFKTWHNLFSNHLFSLLLIIVCICWALTATTICPRGKQAVIRTYGSIPTNHVLWKKLPQPLEDFVFIICKMGVITVSVLLHLLHSVFHSRKPSFTSYSFPWWPILRPRCKVKLF